MHVSYKGTPMVEHTSRTSNLMVWIKWQKKFMFEIAQFWQEVSKRLGSIFEQWTKLHFKLNLERSLMHEPLVCKWTERISLSLCTWSQMVKSLLPIFLLSFYSFFRQGSDVMTQKEKKRKKNNWAFFTKLEMDGFWDQEKTVLIEIHPIRHGLLEEFLYYKLINRGFEKSKVSFFH